MNFFKSLLFFLICLLSINAALPLPVQACVGKKIIIGTLADTEQEILANMLALMIRERTGTTVEIKQFAQMDLLAEALKNEKIQVYNEYLSTALKDLQLKAGNIQAKILFKKVKKEYNRRYNQIWLTPYGFLHSRVTEMSQLSAAPLIDKQTLKLFPALPRLLKKLGGQIDDMKLASLIESVEVKQIPVEDVAREFLKKQKLI